MGKSNSRTCGKFECDMTWFFFVLILSVLMNGATSEKGGGGGGRGGEGEGWCLKLDVQREGGGKISDVDGQGVGVLEN